MKTEVEWGAINHPANLIFLCQSCHEDAHNPQKQAEYLRHQIEKNHFTRQNVLDMLDGIQSGMVTELDIYLEEDNND